MISIDLPFMVDFLINLLNTPSPTGYTDAIIDMTEQTLKTFPDIKLFHTRKGALVGRWEGIKSDAPRALTAHVDTLGAMVKEIKANGRLVLTKIGGFPWNTVEGEGCWIFASQGDKVRGSLLPVKSSVHVYGQTAMQDLSRGDENMEVRLDARTLSRPDTEALGIQVGDFVAFDPRVEVHLAARACAHRDRRTGRRR